MTKEIVKNKKYGIEYTVLRKNVKNVNMRIQDGGQIVISANPYVPLDVIDRFVDDKISWVLEKQKEQVEKMDSRTVSEDEVFYFGKKLKLQINDSPYERITINDDSIVVSAKTKERANRILEKELDRQLQNEIENMVDIYLDKLRDYRLERPEIRYRKMSRRWGSCEPARVRLTFNKNLMIAPKPFIEYVVLHELVHMIQPNHSKAFYNVISNHMPDYKQRIAMMQ